MILAGKRILISGANGLLGRAVVKEILSQGGSVIATDINLQGLNDCFDETKSFENRLVTSVLDLNDEALVESFFIDLEDVDGAINLSYPRNSEYGKSFFNVSLPSFNENVSLHLGSTFLFSKQCAAYFNRFKVPFSLVNISSVYGVIAPKFDLYENTNMTMPVEYSVIKSSIIHLNKYISAYMKDSRFRVNSISPGGILDGQPPEFIKSYKEKTRGKGMLDPGDVVGSILFLLSDQSQYITGQNITVDDGFTL